jgi:Holliday junction resolvasome RuvABC endonuclease subunit
VSRPLRVLGLDLKPARSGVARTHASDGEPRLSVNGVGIGNLWSIYPQVRAVYSPIAKALNMEPDLVVIEGTFSRPGGSDYGQHAVHFMVTELLDRRGIPFVNVSPKKLKVFSAGNGDATKRDVCAQVVADYGRLLHIDPNDDDACDAVAAMAFGLAGFGQPLTTVPEKQRRALDGFVWPKLIGEN